MQFVTDANVIFSCLISGKEQYLHIVSENKFYLPDFALTEIQLYQELITENLEFQAKNFVNTLYIYSKS